MRQIDATDQAWNAAARAYDVITNFHGEINSDDDWPTCNTCELTVEEIAKAERVLSEFVRSVPGELQPETLYRFAHGQGFHRGDPDCWDALAVEFRTAYRVFIETLKLFDRINAEERARAAAAEPVAPAPPQIVRADDTILARHGSVLDRIDDKPATIIVGATDAQTDGAAMDSGRPEEAAQGTTDTQAADGVTMAAETDGFSDAASTEAAPEETADTAPAAALVSETAAAPADPDTAVKRKKK